MTSEIFISYSRRDSKQALELAERLRQEGLGVWMDQYAIAGAEQWATEIVEGIRACSTFILLLSANSIDSENVLKELSLASEKRKRIVPVELWPVNLPSSFEYALAGLQRVSYSNFDSILRSHTHGVARISTQDNRKALIVLPFEDLSPPGEDNAWFADGLTGEMIDTLCHLKSLRVLDRKTSIALRGTKLRIVEIGREFNSRYFIEGSVRKFGDQIKISVSLLDIETGQYLWQESLKGRFENIFEIQEAVAAKVVTGFKLHLTQDEQAKMREHGTENVEAYELFVKAHEYFVRHTKEGFDLEIQLLSEAIKLDAGYANAYVAKANNLTWQYRAYRRDPALIDEAMHLVQTARELKPDLWIAYHPLFLLYQLQDRLEDAERTAKEYVRNAPDDFLSHSTLGFYYWQTGHPKKAIEHYERSVALNTEDLGTHWNLVICCSEAGQEEDRRIWANVAIARYERHLKFIPDDEDKRVQHAVLLHLAGRDDEARRAARLLGNIRDGVALFNTAALQCDMQDYDGGLQTVRRAIESGFRNIRYLKNFLLNEQAGVGTLRGTAAFDEVNRMIEQIEASPQDTEAISI